MKKTITITLILALTATSIILIGDASTQSVPKPSVPEFTVKYVDRSYDVPVTYTTKTDPYTGEQTTITQGGNHVTNRTIEVTIKNQHFTPMKLEDNHTISLAYAIRYKGHFEEHWTTLEYGRVPSDTDYTVRTYTSGSDGFYIPEKGQLDFQVQAQLGYHYMVYAFINPLYVTFQSVKDGDWSTTQTITIAAINGSPNPTPTVPEFSVWAILPLLAFIPLIATVILRKRSLTNRSCPRLKS